MENSKKVPLFDKVVTIGVGLFYLLIIVGGCILSISNALQLGLLD